MYQQAPGQSAPQMQRPQNPNNMPQQGPQPMVFGNQQQAMVGQGNQPGMPAQAMAMPAGMVQVQPGQNPGMNMQAVPKFGMQDTLNNRLGALVEDYSALESARLHQPSGATGAM